MKVTGVERKESTKHCCGNGCLRRDSAEHEEEAGALIDKRMAENNTADADRQASGLLETIVSRGNLNAAYKRVKRNKGAGGVGGMKVDELLQYLRDNGEGIRQSILAGKYQPQPVRRVEIPKDNGKTRKLNQEKALNVHQTERLETIRKIYEQQKYMYDNHTHSVENRIVSVSQPFVRPIVRGKADKPVEFGMKLDISVTDGWTRLEYRSFDAYNEATKLQEMIENFHKREGHYPSRVLADKIYRNRENLSYCKERGIRLSGPALGRPKKGEDRNKAQDYQDECERVEIERKFSLGKRKCGMGLVTAKLEETAAHVVALSILLLNLRKIQCAFLQFWDWLLGFLQSREKLRAVQ